MMSMQSVRLLGGRFFFFTFLCQSLCLARVLPKNDGAERRHECVATFTEGQTAELSFSIPHDALEQHDFFAHLRRSDGTDIVICDRNSPVECKTLDQRYQSNKILNESLTLMIPKVTRQFEDTYEFQAYASSEPLPPKVCRLTVQGVTWTRGCTTSTVAVGETGEIKFFFDDQLALSNNFQMHLRRATDPASDILTCYGNSSSKCKVLNQSYESEGIESGTLSLRIPKMSADFEDVYVLQVHVNGSSKFPSICRLSVKREGLAHTFNNNKESSDSDWIAAFSVVLVVAVILMSLLTWLLIRKRNCKKNASNLADGKDDPRALLLAYQQPNRVPQPEGERWFCERMSREKEKRLLKFRPNCSGTFLIRQRTTNKAHYTLAVLFEGEIQHFIIVPEENGVRCIDTEAHFPSLPALVTFYQEHDIKVDDKIWGKLSKPFEEELEADNQCGDNESKYDKKWFWENISREGEKQLLKVRRNGSGSFLIRQRITNPAHHTLSVLFEDRIRHFTIVPDENGVRCIDTEAHFPSLPALVTFYQEHDIKVDDKIWGKLTKPFEKELEAEWYFGRISDKDEANLLKSGEKDGTGTFLVEDGSRGVHDYVLAVNHEGTVKRFSIAQRKGMFMLLDDPSESFQTLHELVDHYKEHSIGNNRGDLKLTEPAEKEPNEEWYHKTFSTEEEIQLLQSKCKKEGHFRIAPGNTNPNHYILTVCFEEEWRRFFIKAERSGFMFLDVDMFFHSWHELVDYYKTHDIKERTKTWGKLTAPFRQEPLEKWYFGKFSRDEEQKLLDVRGNGAGAFLIREGVSDPENYVLTVNVDAKLKHFTILPYGKGFKLRETDEVFQKLELLVEHYRENELKVGDAVVGKLTEPFKALSYKSKEDPAQNILTRAEGLDSPSVLFG